MSEGNYTKLRQRLGYKPTYSEREYSVVDRVVEFFSDGKKRKRISSQSNNTGARHNYRRAKKRMKS